MAASVERPLLVVDGSSSTTVRRGPLSGWSRLLPALGAALLLSMFVLPLWSITLHAPQYPEGLSLSIRLTTIVGGRPTDLATINGLNHYIGMRPIDPASIPELVYFPYIVATLVVIAAAAAVTANRKLLVAWLCGLAVFGAVGLYDFWRWAYDYGHNLDAEHAIIKVPGMSYQPPIIGVKQLLNFTAESWPAAGTLMALAAFACGALALWLDHRSNARSRSRAALAALVLVFAVPRDAVAQQSIVVSPSGPVTTIAAGITQAPLGGRVIVKAGRYREPMIVVDKPVTIVGDGWPELDGENAHQIMAVTANDVTVRGLVFRDVGTSYTEDRAAIKVANAQRCTIEDNRIDNGFFGIYLAGVTQCRVARNVITGVKRGEGASGNGIHLWSSRAITIEDNRVRGHRDGIYFEFVRESTIRGNTSAENLRYGLHFMYSDSCRYERNIFRANGAGVAVMYTKNVAMLGNRFEHNWGSASYGLLLKEVYDVELAQNRFLHNTVGLVADGANRIDATHNEFVENGWALKLMASTDGGRFTANNFVANSFDVATNSRQSASEFEGNFWSAYRGYDLNRDGVGDVPFHPVRLFSMLVQSNEPSLILTRSVLVETLDAAERLLPTLTPQAVVDRAPAVRRIQ